MSRHGHRFFVPFPLSPGDSLSLDSHQSKQIAGVLRLREGDHVGLFNGDGKEYAAAIRESGRSSVTVDIICAAAGPKSPSPDVWLALALIKSDRFEWALQKATELGVDRLIPLECEQSVISLRVDRAERRLKRWRTIAVEAAEQSGRCNVPEIDEPMPLAQVLSDRTACQPILLWEDEATTALTSIGMDERPVLLLVGPEGGFSEAELHVARSLRIPTASLGPLTLRAETAAVAAVAMLVGRQLMSGPMAHAVEHHGRAE